MAVSTRSESCWKWKGENQDCIVLSVSRCVEPVPVNKGQELGGTKGGEWVPASGVQIS